MQAEVFRQLSEGDFDFVMSMLLLMYYNEDSSFYALQLHEGEVARGHYTVPNMTIARRLIISFGNYRGVFIATTNFVGLQKPILEGLLKGLVLWLYGKILEGVNTMANALLDVFNSRCLC